MKLLLPLAVVVALGAGCSSEIGDSCSSNTDCSTTGERACDTSQPGGYCTILGCRADGCPSEAMCVQWGDGVDERTFCMHHCGSASDCRSGYQCFNPGRYAADHADDPTFNASDYGVIIDQHPASAMFCTRNW